MSIGQTRYYLPLFVKVFMQFVILDGYTLAYFIVVVFK